MTVLRRIARLRVPLGFIFAIVVVWLAHPTWRTLTIGALTAASGAAIRVWAAGHLEKGREVTVSGPYALTRHPLYVGSTVIGIGLSIACANFVVAGLVLAYLAITLTAAIRTEEAHLTEKFGEAYPDYRAGRAATEQRRFSLGRAMRNREYRAVLGLLIAIAALAIKAAAKS